MLLWSVFYKDAVETDFKRQTATDFLTALAVCIELSVALAAYLKGNSLSNLNSNLNPNVKGNSLSN